ncbi:dimethylsulfonioproprionate lyase family protein [Neotabrizicola sp. sgz301269]|uniref:dimethylsulfonioproprionate lyase family protein n=1 Tax=Neotabrizicola sp. sgz301269 TaxID=3276282 RepID=UPI0037706CD8
MTKALHRHLLTAPHGAPGSARARYGAAMALHGEGLLSDAQLEAYREASALDIQDPALVLADRGLAAPDLAPPDPAEILELLLVELDRLLARTGGEGIAEVRAGLAPAFRQSPTPVPVTPNRVLSAHLPAALAAVARDDPALAQILAAAAPHLRWITYDAYDPGLIGPDFPQAHGFATLVGEDAPFAAQDYDLGLFLIAPDTLYRDHAHPAPELYLPLTGPHRWRFAPGAPFHERPAFAPVWNPPLQPHATLTGRTPFLALFAWTAEVNAPAHVIPAPDWALFEPVS